MPGFFGVVDTSADWSERREQELVAIVMNMSAAMRYESGESENLISCAPMGACIGRVGRFAGDAPDLVDGDERVIVVATGDATAGCADPGAVAAAGLDSCSRAVLEAYRRFGEDGFAALPGICAGFVADRGRGTCLLFNDRYGRERVFLHRAGTRVFFASEAKAILAIAPATRAFNPVGLAQLLACGCTLGTDSLFHGIEVLEGGTLLTFEGERVKRKRYFESSTLEALEPMSSEQFLEAFAEGLRSAVDRYVRAAPKMGISVTGGLDSRMVMASVDAGARDVACYTFGSMYRTTADVSIGSRVASCCGRPHSVIELGTDFLTRLPEHLEQSVYISDGYLGLSGAAELYVNRQARSIAPARMTGNWGGELMRGVRAFTHSIPKGDFIVPELSKELAGSRHVFSTTSENPLSAALFHQMPLQGYGRYSIERSQVTMCSPFLADDVVRLLYRAPVAARQSSAGPAVIRRRPGLLSIPTDLGFLGARPSFARRVGRRALIKAEYFTSHGAPDWLARLGASLPSSLVDSRFLGVDKFQHFRFWMRYDLAPFVRETLAHDRSDLRPWFNTIRVEQMVDDHIAGRANYTDAIDKLLTVAMIQKSLLNGSRGRSVHAGPTLRTPWTATL